MRDIPVLDIFLWLLLFAIIIISVLAMTYPYIQELL